MRMAGLIVRNGKILAMSLSKDFFTYKTIKLRKPRKSLSSKDEAWHAMKLTNWLRSVTGSGRWWFKVTNEGKRTPANGAQMIREGLRAGVADYIFLRPSKGYHFLAIELKPDKTKKPTQEQLAFIEEVKAEGGFGLVCYGVEEAITFISDFYNFPIKNLEFWIN